MNKIILGDFRDFDIPGDAFIFSDPPYNQRYHYREYDDNLKLGEYRALLEAAFKGRRSAIVLYPEETVNLLGGG